MTADHTIALAGNPNAGKTTLFNRLTGARQHVANYPGVTVDIKQGTCNHGSAPLCVYDQPGVTVDIKQGTCNHGSARLCVYDLPGTYSLTAYSQEEVVARDFLVQERPRVTIDIVDAANLERNLYLTVQFLELGIPVVIALNMVDVAAKRGLRIDADKLAALLGVPVVPIVARNGNGIAPLLEAVLNGAADRRQSFAISYGDDLDSALTEMEPIIERAHFLGDTYPARWVALKYLEADEQIVDRGRRTDAGVSAQLEQIVERVASHISATQDTYPEALMADHRYGYIHALMKAGVLTREDRGEARYVSDQIDKVLTNRLLGPLIMVLVLLGLYDFTFTYSQVPVGWCEALFGWCAGLADHMLPDGMLKSLVISGIIDGVGGVLGFVPIILFMFFGIAILEDSGYLARVAFMLDRVFRVFGLHGSSVMAYIISGGIAGGCAVPGVMATRTLRSPPERLATLLAAPYMNCGAKLPIMALLIALFFARQEALVMFMLTMLAWIVALLVARLLRSTIITGPATPFVMELPPYRVPTIRGLLIHTWERTWQYIKKAGTVILAISVVLWALMTFPQLPLGIQQQFAQKRALAAPELLPAIDAEEAQAALRNSIAGRIGRALERITSLAGFDWRTNIALLGGFAAKEVIVSTLGTAYSLGEVDPEGSDALSDILAQSPHWTPVSALSLIVFVMFYAPCFVAVVCIAREAGSWKWGAFSLVFNTVLAFGLAVAVYQVGSLVA